MPGGAVPVQILVVEDQPDVRQLIVLILKQAGFEVDSVASAAEALAQLSRHDYRLVISSFWLGLPMTGLQLASMVRSAWPEVCFILITNSTGQPADVGERHCVEAVLTKPFSTAELRDCVRRVADQCAGRRRAAVSL